MAAPTAIGSQLNHAGAAAMAKPDAKLPRRRGAPRKDYEPVLRDVLRLWLEIGGPNRNGLDRAVRGTITEAYARKVRGPEVKSLRAQINKLLRNTFTSDLLRSAVADAKERGVAVPGWAEIELAEWERLEAEPLDEKRLNQVRKLLPKLPDYLTAKPMPLINTRLMQQVQQMRPLGILYRAFDDLIPEDTPVSALNEVYQAVRPLVEEMMRKRNSRPKN
jgi:hypothetical protein